MNVQNLSTEKTDSILLYTGQGEPIKLNSLWEERTAVLVFVRHFG